MNLSRHFTLDEATMSQTASRKGIANTPTAEALTNMMDAAAQLEEVRLLLAAPINVSSWYRGPKLNSAIGGASMSAQRARNGSK